MGIAETIAQGYKNLDVKLGGILPGGVPIGYKPEQPKTEENKPVPPQPQYSYTPSGGGTVMNVPSPMVIQQNLPPPSLVSQISQIPVVSTATNIYNKLDQAKLIGVGIPGTKYMYSLSNVPSGKTFREDIPNVVSHGVVNVASPFVKGYSTTIQTPQEGWFPSGTGRYNVQTKSFETPITTRTFNTSKEQQLKDIRGAASTLTKATEVGVGYYVNPWVGRAVAASVFQPVTTSIESSQTALPWVRVVANIAPKNPVQVGGYYLFEKALRSKIGFIRIPTKLGIAGSGYYTMKNAEELTPGEYVDKNGNPVTITASDIATQKLLGQVTLGAGTLGLFAEIHPIDWLGKTKVAEGEAGSKDIPKLVEEPGRGKVPTWEAKDVTEKIKELKLKETPSELADVNIQDKLLNEQRLTKIDGLVVTQVSPEGGSPFNIINIVKGESPASMTVKEIGSPGLTRSFAGDIGFFGAPPEVSKKVPFNILALEEAAKLGVRRPIINPEIPKLDILGESFVSAAGKGDIVPTGSFAQKVIFPEARAFGDYDAIAENPIKAAKKVVAEAVSLGREEYNIKADNNPIYGKYPKQMIIDKLGNKVAEFERTVNGVDLWKRATSTVKTNENLLIDTSSKSITEPFVTTEFSIEKPTIKVASPEILFADKLEMIKLAAEKPEAAKKAAGDIQFLTSDQIKSKYLLTPSLKSGSPQAYTYYAGGDSSFYDVLQGKSKLGFSRPAIHIWENLKIDKYPEEIIKSPITKFEKQEAISLIKLLSKGEPIKGIIEKDVEGNILSSEQLKALGKQLESKGSPEQWAMYRRLTLYSKLNPGVYPGAGAISGIKPEWEITQSPGVKNVLVPKTLRGKVGKYLGFGENVLSVGNKKFEVKLLEVMKPEIKNSLILKDVGSDLFTNDRSGIVYSGDWLVDAIKDTSKQIDAPTYPASKLISEPNKFLEAGSLSSPGLSGLSKKSVNSPTLSNLSFISPVSLNVSAIYSTPSSVSSASSNISSVSSTISSISSFTSSKPTPSSSTKSSISSVSSPFSMSSTSSLVSPSSSKTPSTTGTSRTQSPLQKVSRISKSKKKEEGFYVITKQFKKPVLITPKPLSKGQALAFGLGYAKKTERATFKLVPSKEEPVSIALRPITETEVWKAGFRPPVKRGKIQPTSNTFIQRRKTRMGTKVESRAIQSYKGNPYWSKAGMPRGKVLW